MRPFTRIRTSTRQFSVTLRLSIVIPKRRTITDEFQVNPINVRRETKVFRDLKKVKRKTKRDTTDITSRDAIQFLEIKEAISTRKMTLDQISNSAQLIDTFLFSKSRPTITVTLDIVSQTTEGEGIGFVPKSMYATPFLEESEEIFDKYTLVIVPKTVIGDKVVVLLVLHHNYYAEGVLLDVFRDSKEKIKPFCKYFEECSGCQLQMLPYSDQLKFKQSTIKKAYQFFYPQITQNEDPFGPVHSSPLQSAYRTKITPHFRHRQDDEILKIGFKHIRPTLGILDVESCGIATQVLNDAYAHKRKEFDSTPKARTQNTLLFRESLEIDRKTGVTQTICVDSNKLTITEMVGDYVFQFEANSFFQNNRSILPSVINYIRNKMKGHNYKYLVDTYCGTGFFGISLSNDINPEGKIFGIELAASAVQDATHNAKLNGLNPAKIQFVEGQADSMFQNPEFKRSGMTGKDCVVIMDPSRKGSTNQFMSQLLDFRPRLIVYISCNVFTQARDLAYFKEICDQSQVQYRVKEIVGFDFFPQTKHVETVAVLELVN